MTKQMRTKRWVLVAVVSLAAGGGVSMPAHAGPAWEIDPAHATASFSVRHMMISNVHGVLGPVRGAVEMDASDPSGSHVRATIEIAGINTGNAKRDTHLKSKEFFDVAKFPTATFSSTEVSAKGEGKLHVRGDLTMHGVTRPVTLEVKLSEAVTNPFTGQVTRAATASTKLKRSDFGLTWQMPMAKGGVLVGEEVLVQLEVELTKPSAK